jgi:hypothetical protein
MEIKPACLENVLHGFQSLEQTSSLLVASEKSTGVTINDGYKYKISGRRIATSSFECVWDTNKFFISR